MHGHRKKLQKRMQSVIKRGKIFIEKGEFIELTGGVLCD